MNLSFEIDGEKYVLEFFNNRIFLSSLYMGRMASLWIRVRDDGTVDWEETPPLFSNDGKRQIEEIIARLHKIRLFL
jgi:hypothetical protein